MVFYDERIEVVIEGLDGKYPKRSKTTIVVSKGGYTLSADDL